MIIKKSEYELSAVGKSQYPKDKFPEIALAGRSNVGKSSFINTMLGRKNLARTSSTPGKTRAINFYRFNDCYRFVDLPGYGYAKVSKKERESWGEIINEYLTNRDNLREVLLVVDSRHEPTSQDVMMYDWIREMGFKGLVIATKIDKIGKTILQKNIAIIKKKLEIEDKELIVSFSAMKREGIERAWNILGEIYD